MMSSVLVPGSPVHVRRIPSVTLKSPRTARHWAEELLAGMAILDAALIAISELVTNVALYAPGSARVTVTHTDAGIEIAVADRRPDGIPAPIDAPDWTAEHQRGLVLCNAFSARGVSVRQVRGWGKEVLIVLTAEAGDE